MNRDVTGTTEKTASASQAAHSGQTLQSGPAAPGEPLLLVRIAPQIAGPVTDPELLSHGLEEELRRLRRLLQTLSLPQVSLQRDSAGTVPTITLTLRTTLPRLQSLLRAREDTDDLCPLFCVRVTKTPGTARGLKNDARTADSSGEEERAEGSRKIQQQDPLSSLQAQALLRSSLRRVDATDIAAAACRALLYEVAATPKPGLVDRENNGSHDDMSVFTFLSSAASLQPSFYQFALTGIDTAEESPEATFARLRPIGLAAEGIMTETTHGVNTHKGAIYSVGLLCAALGRLGRGSWSDVDRVLDECGAMVRRDTENFFSHLTHGSARSAGERLYLQYGIRGIRGQAADGFPAVRRFGLPVLVEGLSRGLSLNDAGVCALLHMLAHDTDTNMIHRSSRQVQEQKSRELRDLLSADPFPSIERVRALDGEYIREHLSPGGSADLLSLCYLLFFLSGQEEGRPVC